MRMHMDLIMDMHNYGVVYRRCGGEGRGYFTVSHDLTVYIFECLMYAVEQYLICI